MFVLDRQRTAELEETVQLAGTTGNVYTVTINKSPSCNCPHALKKNQCKHVVYVLNRVLKAPFHLQYQLAFLTCELQEIFEAAPPLPGSSETEEDDGKRKAIEKDDDCPICCVEFSETEDETVYCKAACGNNMHKACFQQWASQKKAGGEEITCPFCRTLWQTAFEGDKAVKDILRNLGAEITEKTEEGYVNVKDALGLNGIRGMPYYLLGTDSLVIKRWREVD